MNLSDAQRTKAWPTRRLRYGPRGNPPKPKRLRKPSARAKRVADPLTNENTR